MKTKRLFITLATCLLVCGCNTDSKESLEKKAVSIMGKMAKTLNTVDSEAVANKAIIKLEKLQKELNETKAKLSEYGNQDIASEYGMRMFNCYMNQVIPALEKAQKNAPESYDTIADIITSGEHTKLKEEHEKSFGTNIPTGEDYIKAHPQLDQTIADCIRNKQVMVGMNKEEIIASLGTPNSVGRDNKGGEELIYMDNGKMITYYLIDGIYKGAGKER